MYVEEKDRSWCTSSAANDNRAITIEVASDTFAPYAVNAKAYAALIDLVTDICQRNGIRKLLWKGDKSLIGQADKQNMTVHRWFANKSCPGDYLYERHGAIADEVNRRLSAADTAPGPERPTAAVKAGDAVSLAANATYYTGKAIPAWVKAQHWIVKEVKGDRAVIDRNVSSTNAIMSPVNVKFLTVVGTAAPAYGTYTVVKGDSLWGIANKKLGDGERYPEIKALNGLTSNTIYAGQVLQLPK
jgi:LysM repeat protein